MSEMVYGSFIAEAFNACMHVHMTDEGAVTAAGLSGGQTPATLQPLLLRLNII